MMKENFNQGISRQVLVFKRWSRKGYSLFNVLKKLVVIASLLVVYHISADARNARLMVADTIVTEIKIGLDEIEVSAQRVPVTYSQVARIVSVIEKSEIEASPARSVQELLSQVLSVDVRQRGAEGVQSDISIRGGSFDQVIVLLNGVNITDPQTGHFSFNLPVSLSQVQRIEVLEGPASRVFGANAFSGAINIITGEINKSQVSAELCKGSFGYFDGGISGSLKSGTFSQFLALNRMSSSGYIHNTDFETNNFYYRAGKNFGSAKIAGQFGFTGKGFGANSFYTPKYPDQYEKIKTFFSSLKFESGKKIRVTPAVYWRRHYDRFELFRNEAPSWYTSHNYHRTDVFGMNLNSWTNTVAGKTAVGFDFRGEKILSNVLGKLLEKPVDVKGEPAQYLKSDQRYTYSAFIEQSYYSGKCSVSGGMMALYISGTGTGFRFFPGADASFSMSKTAKLYISANHSLRMPTFTDLYYNGPTNTGNPDLKPETATSAEAGVKFSFDFLHGNISLFGRDAKNSIDWVKAAGEEKWHTENYTRILSSGFEINADFFPGKIEKGFFISKISFGYMYNNANKKEGELTSYYVLDHLKHKVNISLSHRILKNVSAMWNLSYQDRNGQYTEYKDGAFGSEVGYKPFWLLDSRINYSRKSFVFYLSAANLFDTHYVDIGNINQPGLWLKAGLSFKIGIAPE